MHTYGDNGLVNEYRVMQELQRRKIPFQHRVKIGHYEVDFLVGHRILIEVDGYVHLTKDNLHKDSNKDQYLKALGYRVLRIKGIEVRNRGHLREFGQRVQDLFEEERNRFQGIPREPLKQNPPQEELTKLRAKLVAQERKKKQKKQETVTKMHKLTDEELFLEEIKRLGRRKRK